MGLPIDVTNQPLLFSRAPFAVTTTTAALGFKDIYGCTSTAAARTLTISSADILKASPTKPWIFRVKDESDGAGTFNITIDTEGSEKIDGIDTLTISVDSGVAILYCDGTNLFTL